jgi:hypothetical protein
MTDPRDDVSRYAAAVRAALADLDPGERAQLLEDLEGHLAEVAAETDGPLTDRLGPPEAYGAELRAAYGARERATLLERLLAARRRRLSRRWRLACLAFFLVISVAAAGTLALESGQLSASDRWSYQQLVAEARTGHVRSLAVTAGNSYVATDRSGNQHDVVGVPAAMPLAAEMVRDGIEVTYYQSTGIHWAVLAEVGVPILLLLLVIGFGVLGVRASARPPLAGAARR